MQSDALFDMCKTITDTSREAYEQGRQQGKREVMLELRQRVPYKEFCSQPIKCAGLGSCPRDPCCCD